MNFYRDLVLPKKIEIHTVFETETVLAYHHTQPFYPVHIVVIPKAFIDNLLVLEDDVLTLELIDAVKMVAKEVTLAHGAAKVITNLGAYQDSKHLHFHVISGKPLNS
jgi:histidine triad (HIT) family protein